MTEIKSTMDLVLERAARMGKASSDDLQQEDDRKEGMKLAAEFLDNKIDNLLTVLTEQDNAKQATMRRGMVETLLRNVFLYRDDAGKERTTKAAQGISEVGGGAGDLASICTEINHILGQYNQHREQLKQQLEEQMRMQYEQILAQQGGEAAGGMNPARELEAKINEEWSRAEGELSAQYNQALEQHKGALRERLS